jgi:hypothetical protein
MYHTPETLLNHVFEDLRKPKAPNINILDSRNFDWHFAHSLFIYLWSYLFHVLWLMSFQVNIMLSHRLKGKWSPQRRQKASTPLHRIIHPSPSLHNALQFGIIFTPILFTKGGKFWKRAYISLTCIRFWRFIPKGEKVLAQSKRTAPPPNSKICLSICIKEVFLKSFKLVSYFWYNFKLVYPLQN